MKKIFTLLFAVGMFTMAQAQPGTRDNRQFDQRNNQQNDQRNFQQNDQKGFNNGYDKGKVVVDANISFGSNGRYDDKFSMDRKKDMEIARINQDYDFKIQRVQRSFFMSWFEKQRQIRSLEQQRQREISMVYAKYSIMHQYDNRYDRNGGYDSHGRSNGHY